MESHKLFINFKLQTRSKIFADSMEILSLVAGSERHETTLNECLKSQSNKFQFPFRLCLDLF